MNCQVVGPVNDATRWGHYCRMLVKSLRHFGHRVVVKPLRLSTNVVEAPESDQPFGSIALNFVCAPFSTAGLYREFGAKNVLIQLNPFEITDIEHLRLYHDFEKVACVSPQICGLFHKHYPDVATAYLPPMIDASLLNPQSVSPAAVSWLPHATKSYRFYAIFPSQSRQESEALVTTYLREFDGKDSTLLVYMLGGGDSLLDFLRKSGKHKTNVTVAGGPWLDPTIAAICSWGDCCLLPWSRFSLPVESLYCLAAGGYAVVSEEASGGLLNPRYCKILSSPLNEKQLMSVMRQAISAGPRKMEKAKESSKVFSYQLGDISKLF